MGHGIEPEYNNQLWEEDFHGCDVLLSGRFTISHKVRGHSSTTPNIRSYRDGIKVGCSFVTNDALELIYQLHHSFLGCSDIKNHQ